MIQLRLFPWIALGQAGLLNPVFMIRVGAAQMVARDFRDYKAQQYIDNAGCLQRKEYIAQVLSCCLLLFVALAREAGLCFQYIQVEVVAHVALAGILYRLIVPGTVFPLTKSLIDHMTIMLAF